MFSAAILVATALTGFAPSPTVESPTLEPVEAPRIDEPSIALPRTADPGVVALVGDSITWEHAAVYDEVLTACGAAPAVIDAIPGRMLTTTDGNPFGPIRSGYEAIAAIESTLDPDTWLIELGVNDVNAGAFDEGGEEAAIGAALDLIDPSDTVIWVGTWTTGPRSGGADRLTQVLDDVGRLIVTDWPSVAAGLVYDGLHPTEAGARAIAEGYCDALG